MNVIGMLRDMQAASSARITYADARQRLHGEWKELRAAGFEEWARQVWEFEMIAERAYKAERDDPEVSRG